MLAIGAVSKFLFSHFHDKANYVETINSKTRAALSTFTDADLDECDTTKEALGELVQLFMPTATGILKGNGLT